MAERHTRYGWWLEEAGLPEPQPPLQGEVEADVVIVGGGYTGMWTAWFIGEAEPNARIALLDAERCGTGPSGRNGGFVNSMWLSLASLNRRFGADQAIRVARASESAVDGIGAWCEEQGVDAWYRRGGYLQVSTTPLHDDAPLVSAQVAAELGVPDECVHQSADEVRRRCSSPLFRSGAFHPAAATVQPARLSQGLRKRLIERGVEVFEGSRAHRVGPTGAGVEVETGHGRIRAGAAVLAAGGRLAAHPSLRRRLTVTSSHMVISEPVPDVLEEIGWTGGECITDSRAMVQYFRTTPDGRIAFGWGGGRVVPGARLNGRAEVDARVAAEVERRVVRVFPGLRGRRIDHAWGGPIDVSPTHHPVIGSLSGERIHYAFGYTGNGVGPTHLAGRTLASMALDRRDELTRLPLVEPPPVRVPPEPFRYAGGTIVRAALLRRERLEEEGRRADPLTRFVAGVPERIGVHIGR
jgi:glycine/D-amino acid oxidase-like deaminating enzyme